VRFTFDYFRGFAMFHIATLTRISALQRGVLALLLLWVSALNAYLTPREVVFIDSSVTDWSILRESVKPSVEVVVLDANADGLAQIAAWARGRSEYDAIHVLSHGAAGMVHLGTFGLKRETMNERAGELAAIGVALKKDGDLLLYGCDVANGESGKVFIDSLSKLIGVNIAASTNKTGARDKGGDWVLEANFGVVENRIISSDEYLQTLAAPTIVSTPITSINHQSAYSYAPKATDADNNLLTWSVKSGTTLPAWLTLTNTMVVSTLAGQAPVTSPTTSAVAETNGGLVDGTGTAAKFKLPYGFTIDNQNNLFVADWKNDAIRKVTPEGVVTTFATGFIEPKDVAIGPDGKLYVADTGADAIYQLDSSGAKTLYAGTGSSGSNEGSRLSATFNNPNSIAFYTDLGITYMYIADRNNGKIRVLNMSDGNVSTLASGFDEPTGVSLDSRGDIFVAERGDGNEIDPGTGWIKKITMTTRTSGSVSTIATLTDGTANESNPYDVMIDNFDNVYVAGWNANKIFKLIPNYDRTSYTLSILVGSTNGHADSGETSTFSRPIGLGTDKNGYVYVADHYNNTIRKIEFGYRLTGTPTTPGIYPVSLTVSDGSNQVDHIFNITVLDITAPTFDVAPAVGSVTASGFIPSASINEAGTINYVVVANNATAPTVANVKAGQANGGGAALASGNSSVTTGNFDSNFSAVTDLAASTDYDVYFVATDTANNGQAVVTKVDATTANNTNPTITEGASTSVTMSEDSSPTAFSLTLNATDTEQAESALTWSISTPASNGTASVSGTGASKAISYTPTANFNGSDNFIVQVSDGQGGTDTITVNVTITPVAETPSVTSVNPVLGTALGGTTVTLAGTDFTGATAVRFGATNATSFTVNSATQITATSPLGSVGTVNITVTTPIGTSTASDADQFTYQSVNQNTLTASAAPSPIAVGGTSALSTTGGSGTGAVTYAVTAGSGFCSVNGTTLTGMGVGTCTITATKASDANYNATTATVNVTASVDIAVLNALSIAELTAKGNAFFYDILKNANESELTGLTLERKNLFAFGLTEAQFLELNARIQAMYTNTERLLNMANLPLNQINTQAMVLLLGALNALSGTEIATLGSVRLVELINTVNLDFSLVPDNKIVDILVNLPTGVIPQLQSAVVARILSALSAESLATLPENQRVALIQASKLATVTTLTSVPNPLLNI
jgi:sugar lactone lactonase YvrE